MSDTFDLDETQRELTQDEGRRAYPYTDTKGYLSIGVGRNLTGRGLSADEIDLMLANDIADAAAIMDHNIPWWRNLPPAQQRVMINLCFMGWGSFSQFVHFFTAMKSGNRLVAADEIKNSRWYQQVGDRGPRVVARLLAPDGAPPDAV
jgi:lysozyme